MAGLMPARSFRMAESVLRATAVATGLLLAGAAGLAAAEPLRVLATTGPETFFYSDESGGTEGLEYDILASFAKTHGRTVEVVWVDAFDEPLDRLAAGDGEVVAGMLTITPERAERFDFTVSYLPVQVALVEPPGRLTSNPEGLVGQRVATTKGTIHETLLSPRPRIQDVQVGEDLSVEASVASQEPICLKHCVGADQEVGDHPIPGTRASQAVQPPECACGFRRISGHRLELDPEDGKRGVEGFSIGEMSPYLRPDHVTGDQGACVVGEPERLSRSLTELSIGSENVE